MKSTQVGLAMLVAVWGNRLKKFEEGDSVQLSFFITCAVMLRVTV